MEENPIDDLNEIQSALQNNDPVVKPVMIALCIIGLVFSFLCFKEIFEWIYNYCYFRHKLITFLDIHSMAVAVSVSTIPLTAYSAWRKRFVKQGFISYLILLAITLILFVTIYLIGFELIFYLAQTGNRQNPLLPSYAIYPPFSFCFNLQFILAAILPFLILQVFIRRKAKK